MSEKTLVIIPTYNESENISLILESIENLNLGVEILVIDDNSPDGTAEIVKDLSKINPKIHLLQREGKLGLGTAYVKGFQWAIENNYDIVCQMDADFSHSPEVLRQFLETIKDNDLVIGSRYITGVNVVNWPLSRLLLSYFANVYSKIITGMPIKDATGGFKCIRIEALKAIDLNRVHSDGYSFQIEINFKIWVRNFRVKEIPIIFRDRERGTSKMHPDIIWEAAFLVWRLRLGKIFGNYK
ncbi:MAG: polyprenol monophosphomannose synthase [Calditrichaeota bacterium]|nr:MAG: polyprenol monophosphomannose synthase [Calditrichota bacterium]